MAIVSKPIGYYQRVMADPNQPLLFFDTGVGGLSVFAKVKAAMPNAPMVYAADYAGLPYGEKTEMEVATRVCALLGRLTERFRPRLVVIACNTASVIALGHVRAVLGVPIVGTVPAIKPAALATQTGVIGLLGTNATIRQPYVDRLQAEHASGMTMLRHAAPDLVYAAEAKLRGDTPDMQACRDAIAGLIDQNNGQNLDAMVLGCTHFPLLVDELEQAARDLGHAPKIAFVDGSGGIARRVEYVTTDHIWPKIAQPGIFITTGGLGDMSPYASHLSTFGLSDIQSL